MQSSFLRSKYSVHNTRIQRILSKNSRSINSRFIKKSKRRDFWITGATPAFEKRELPHPSPRASKELKFFKSRTSNANFICKARVLRSRYSVHNTRIQRILSKNSRSINSRFIKKSKRCDFWITGASVRLSKKDQEIDSLWEARKQKLSGIEYFMATSSSYPQKKPLEVELYASRRSPKRYLKRCLLILKSLNSDNLWKRLKKAWKLWVLAVHWNTSPWREEK